MLGALLLATLLCGQAAGDPSQDVLTPTPAAPVEPAVPPPAPTPLEPAPKDSAPPGDMELQDNADDDGEDEPAPRRDVEKEEPKLDRPEAWARVGREAAAGTVAGLSTAVAGLLLELLIVSVPVLAVSFFIAFIVAIIVAAIVGIFGGSVDVGALMLQITAILFVAIMVILSPVLLLGVPVLDALAFTATAGGLALWQRREALGQKKRAVRAAWARAAAHGGLAVLAGIPVAVLAMGTFAVGGGIMLLALNPDLLARFRIPTWVADPNQPIGPLFLLGLAGMPLGILLGLGGAMLVRPAAYALMAGGLDTVMWPDRGDYSPRPGPK